MSNGIAGRRLAGEQSFMSYDKTPAMDSLCGCLAFHGVDRGDAGEWRCGWWECVLNDMIVLIAFFFKVTAYPKLHVMDGLTLILRPTPNNHSLKDVFLPERTPDDCLAIFCILHTTNGVLVCVYILYYIITLIITTDMILMLCTLLLWRQSEAFRHLKHVKAWIIFWN